MTQEEEEEEEEEMMSGYRRQSRVEDRLGPISPLPCPLPPCPVGLTFGSVWRSAW